MVSSNKHLSLLKVKAALLVAPFLLAIPVVADQSPTEKIDDWRDYYQHSTLLKKRDDVFIANELSAQQLSEPIPAVAVNRFILPQQNEAWLLSSEAQTIADNVLSFQTPSGGWSKRTDMISGLRKVGQAFGSEKRYIPTFDNNATTDQVRFLAAMYAATKQVVYQKAVEKAINLILAAQYPNGCWPQTYPLVGGYHDHITFNDGVIVNNLDVLDKIVNNGGDYALLDTNEDFLSLQAQAKVAINLGVQCLLETQVKVNGVLTVWGAQHDVQTLQPTSARAYEMASLASEESQGVVEWLMHYASQNSSANEQIILTLDSAIAWFRQTKIDGYRWHRVGASVAELVEDTDGPLLWARFYEIGTNKPVFGDRDGTIHYDVNKISLERRLRYGWFNEGPRRLIREYESWRKDVSVKNIKPAENTKENSH